MTEGLFAAVSQAGWLQACDPRLRIVAACGFALCVVSLTGMPAVLTGFTLAMLLAMVAGLTGRALGQRLLALEGFMLILLSTLPFTVPGEALVELGPLAASAEGVRHAALILFKANAVVLALLVLVGSLDPGTIGHALARLGVPDRLVHLLLFTVRQIHLLHREYRRLRQAMRARAFVPHSDRHTWNSLGWLIGMLLVRGIGRSQRLVDAMRCRGFQGRLYLLDSLSWRRLDSLLAAACTASLGGLLLLDRLA